MTCLAVPSLLTANLIAEWHSRSGGQVLPDLWSALPFILLPLALLLVSFWILIAHRRLVRTGEMSLAKVMVVKSGPRGRRTITYDFSDRSGRLISASSPDNWRTISVGMVVPVFYNPENPQGDQVALCGSFTRFRTLLRGRVLINEETADVGTSLQVISDLPANQADVVPEI